MKIGVLADTHDRVPAIRELLRQFAERGIGLVLHCGDYCSPFALQPFIDVQMTLAGVFGRCDGDREVADAAPGELLAVHGAGAYGYAMAMNYNSRRRPAEVLVDGDRYAVITRRETYEDLVRAERESPDWETA